MRNGESEPHASRGNMTPWHDGQGTCILTVTTCSIPHGLGDPRSFPKLLCAGCVMCRAGAAWQKRTMCTFDGGEILQGNILLYLMQMGLHDLPPLKKLCLFSAFMKGWSLVLLIEQSPPVAAVHCDSVCAEPCFLPSSLLLHSTMGKVDLA